LREAINFDTKRESKNVTVAWEVNQQVPEKMDFLGIDYEKKKDPLTGIDYVEWKGKPRTYKELPVYVMNKAKVTVSMPKKIWIPSQYSDIVERLKLHGIKVSRLTESRIVNGTQFKSVNHKLSNQTFENRQMVTSEFELQLGEFNINAHSYMIETNQPLARLAVALLDPRAPDSFFSWGFFNHIFQRTEYIESYVMIPLARQLFQEFPSLKREFEQKKELEEEFSSDQQAQLSWLYSRSEFYDKEYSIYPIIMSY